MTVFGAGFAHYLSYGATDQQTVRSLAGTYQGLLVPGTVAAFQREGTGGFVLTLSATDDPPDYVIDPRFPLFQQALTTPKRSHESLADACGDPSLVTSTAPRPEDFTPERIELIARSWADFNGTYRTAAGGKFEKYARRLGQPLEASNSKNPAFVLAPYFAASSVSDPWWAVSKRLYTATAKVVSAPACIRVVAAQHVSALSELLQDVSEERLAIWTSGLEELKAPVAELIQYAEAIRAGSERGAKTFALYGGFFSVLLGNLGLSGSSHGVGYGEYRNWVELPASGPPPARYYLPRVHRYVQPDEALRLYQADTRLAACSCEECNGEAPILLDYHGLMRHSVRCRAREIAEWSGLDRPTIASRLDEEATTFLNLLENSGLADFVVARSRKLAEHLPRWAAALR